jgi:hypothetical protein
MRLRFFTVLLPALWSIVSSKLFLINMPSWSRPIRPLEKPFRANIDRDTFMPIHPGALRYYREIGIDVPAVLAGDRWSTSGGAAH